LHSPVGQRHLVARPLVQQRRQAGHEITQPERSHVE
jgi:hypothetical protein